jgi:hypothetical protein
MFFVRFEKVFSVKREKEEERFNPKNLGNRKLLWHGSRLSNYVGILSTGSENCFDLVFLFRSFFFPFRLLNAIVFR